MLNGSQNAARSMLMPSRAGTPEESLPHLCRYDTPTVVLAQTRVGFLTGGRKSFLICRQMNKLSNWRRRSLVLRCYGAGHLWCLDVLASYLHDHDLYHCLLRKPSLICSNRTVVRQACTFRRLLVEVLQDHATSFHEVRGLHLFFFFCSLLLECDLAKKVPGRAPFSQHDIFRNWAKMN